MAKFLKVKDPFLRLDFGDVFEQAENGDYVSTVNENFSNDTDEGATFTTRYHATFSISKDYAEQMVKDGYLEEVVEKKEDKQFVNIFDEIDSLIQKYTNELKKTNEDKTMHPLVSHESNVVYSNLLTLLEHLKNLKK